MWAIAKHILFEKRHFVWMLLFISAMIVNTRDPLILYIFSAHSCLIFLLYWQTKRIKLYLSMPVSQAQVARLVWFFSVLAGPLCSLGYLPAYCLGRYVRPVQDYFTETNLSMYPIFFFLFVSYLSLLFILIYEILPWRWSTKACNRSRGCNRI